LIIVKDLKEQGAIPINIVNSVDIETDPQIFKAPSPHLFRLNVSGARKFYLFSTESPLEKDEWVSSIRDQLTIYNEKRDSVASHLGMHDDKLRRFRSGNTSLDIEPSSPVRSPIPKKRDTAIKLDSSALLNTERELAAVHQYAEELPFHESTAPYEVLFIDTHR
jgi:hypothetical protein